MSAVAPRPERRILVVDDDEHTRHLLKDLCEASGFLVTQAADGVEAIEAAHREPPDLVLLDLMMPRRDGFSVLKELRETPAFADLPVILLTAMGDMDGKIRGMELGADDYVTKPFKLIELQTRINSALTVRDYRSRLVAAEEELAQLRTIDPVTGAGTYSQLKAGLDGEVARSRRYGRPVAALLFGFGDFAQLRYSMGRDGCDLYLVKVTAEIRRTLRGADRLYRISADEFVILLPETDLAGAHTAAVRLEELVGQVEARGREGELAPEVYVAGAVFPHERVRSGEDLLREANRVYRAVRASGTRRVFEP